MPSLAPFTPGSSVSIGATDATGRVALPTTRGDQVLIYSPAANDPAWIKFGTSTVTAALTDIAIPPGFNRVFTVPASATYIAAICDTAKTATLYFTSGDGQ